MSEHEGPGDSTPGRVRVVRLTGDVDLANAAEIREQLLRESSNDLIVMVVDMSGLTFIDSSGLRVLFEVAGLLQERDQRLFLVIPSGAHPWRTLEVSGAERVARVFEDVESAKAAAASEV